MKYNMERLDKLSHEIEQIKLRNKRVEADKAWETSYTRKFSLVLITYLVISLFMSAMHINEPWKNAIIPSMGFFISTLSLTYIKILWKKYIYK
jgi:hypothetical protein